MLVRTQHVRESSDLIDGGWVTGDGAGSPNPVDCQGADTILLYIYAESVSPAVKGYEFKVDFYAGGDSPYADSNGTDAATRALSEVVFSVSPDETALSERFVIATPVHGRYARVSARYNTGATAPRCAIVAATAKTHGGEGQTQGLFRVKEPGFLGAGESVTGDGAGTENAFPISNANHTSLLFDFNADDDDTLLYVTLETSLNGSEFYRETWYEPGGGAVAVSLRTYKTVGVDWGNQMNHSAIIGIDTLGSWARFTFSAVDFDANNVAAQALVGRV